MPMILNKADFKKLHDELEEADSQREHIIKEARDVLKGSKTMIYSVQRNELNHAGKLKEELKKDLKKVVEKCRKFPDLYYSGSIKVAEQEFVEALCFYEFVKNKSLPTVSDLGVTSENYLLGLCDLSGELTRKAINASIKENYDETLAPNEVLQNQGRDDDTLFPLFRQHANVVLDEDFLDQYIVLASLEYEYSDHTVQQSLFSISGLWHNRGYHAADLRCTS